MQSRAVMFSSSSLLSSKQHGRHKPNSETEVSETSGVPFQGRFRIALPLSERNAAAIAKLAPPKLGFIGELPPNLNWSCCRGNSLTSSFTLCF